MFPFILGYPVLKCHKTASVQIFDERSTIRHISSAAKKSYVTETDYKKSSKCTPVKAERPWLASDVYTRIASFHVHLKGCGFQCSIISEYLVQPRDDNGDDDDDYATMIKQSMDRI